MSDAGETDPRYSDYDSRGHVNNAVYLTYFEVARHRAWRVLTGLLSDFPFIIAEAHVRTTSVRPSSAIRWRSTSRRRRIRTKAWVWSYRIVDVRDQRLVAEGSTVQVYYDYDLQTTMPIPDIIRPNLVRD